MSAEAILIAGNLSCAGDYGETWTLYAHQLPVDEVVQRIKEVLECSSS